MRVDLWIHRSRIRWVVKMSLSPTHGAALCRRQWAEADHGRTAAERSLLSHPLLAFLPPVLRGRPLEDLPCLFWEDAGGFLRLDTARQPQTHAAAFEWVGKV